MSNPDWPKVRLGDPSVAVLIMGQSPDSTTYNIDKIGLPFFQGKSDFGSRYPTPSIWCSSPQRIAEPGDVLISVRAPVGDVNIATETSCVGRGIAAVRSGPKALNEFLFYSLMHYREKLDSLGHGAIFRAINKATLAEFEIPLPKLPDQRVIAKTLSTIQSAVEAQIKTVAKLKELKAAVMAKLFREGLKGEKLKQTEIGEIPESWEIQSLGTIAKPKGGKRLPKGEKFAGQNTRHPYIRIVDFYNHSVKVESVKFIGDEIYEKISRYTITKEDVYFSIAGTIGVVGVIPEELDGANLTENAAKFVLNPEEKHLRDYLMWYLSSATGQAQIVSRTMKTSQPKIGLGKLATILIPIPRDLDECLAIARTMNIIKIKFNVAEKLLEGSAQTFQLTLNHIFHDRAEIGGGLDK